MMSRSSARSIKDWHDRMYATKAGWNLPNETQKTVHEAQPPLDTVQRPQTGRNTKLGRKVEKPRDPKSGGPSGQQDRARHDKRHANK
jgi:hypothetical protein